MGDVIPHYVVRVRGKRALDIVCVLCGEVPVDDVHGTLPRLMGYQGTEWVGAEQILVEDSGCECCDAVGGG